ncbi:hypothetical protein OAQ28_08800 [Planktomarina temperata]|nr:hypothetical protein [Planktomarina temperata]
MGWRQADGIDRYVQFIRGNLGQNYADLLSQFDPFWKNVDCTVWCKRQPLADQRKGLYRGWEVYGATSAMAAMIRPCAPHRQRFSSSALRISSADFPWSIKAAVQVNMPGRH